VLVIVMNNVNRTAAQQVQLHSVLTPKVTSFTGNIRTR